MPQMTHGFLLMIYEHYAYWTANTLAPQLRMNGATIILFRGRPPSSGSQVVLVATWATKEEWQAFRTSKAHDVLMEMVRLRVYENGLMPLDWCATLYPGNGDDFELESQ